MNSITVKEDGGKIHTECSCGNSVGLSVGSFSEDSFDCDFDSLPSNSMISYIAEDGSVKSACGCGSRIEASLGEGGTDETGVEVEDVDTESTNDLGAEMVRNSTRPEVFNDDIEYTEFKKEMLTEDGNTVGKIFKMGGGVNKEVYSLLAEGTRFIIKKVTKGILF